MYEMEHTTVPYTNHTHTQRRTSYSDSSSRLLGKDVWFGTNMGQIGPKWDKSWTF